MTVFSGKGVYGAIAIGKLSIFKKNDTTIKRMHVEDTDRRRDTRNNQRPKAVDQPYFFHNNKQRYCAYLWRHQHRADHKVKQHVSSRERIFRECKTRQGAEKQGSHGTEDRSKYTVERILEHRDHLEQTLKIGHRRRLNQN